MKRMKRMKRKMKMKKMKRKRKMKKMGRKIGEDEGEGIVGIERRWNHP